MFELPDDWVRFCDGGVMVMTDRSGQIDPVDVWAEEPKEVAFRRRCRVCGCTDEDCSGCVARTGQACFWVSNDLCSACEDEA